MRTRSFQWSIADGRLPIENPHIGNGHSSILNPANRPLAIIDRQSTIVNRIDSASP
jgi:hypothetical protein